MRKLYRRALTMLEALPHEIRHIEKKKETSKTRSQSFIMERKSTSEVHKRIESMRGAIQHKSQSDQ